MRTSALLPNPGTTLPCRSAVLGLLLAGILFLSWTAAGAGDTIRLVDGTSLEATVLGDDGREIYLVTTGKDGYRVPEGLQIMAHQGRISSFFDPERHPDVRIMRVKVGNPDCSGDEKAIRERIVHPGTRLRLFRNDVVSIDSSRSAAETAPGDAVGARARDVLSRRRTERPCLDSVAMIESGLDWLCRHQGEDGSWNPGEPAGSCAGGFPCVAPTEGEEDVRATALAALAILGYGVEPGDDREWPAAKGRPGMRPGVALHRALQWLRAHQDDAGNFVGVGDPTGTDAHAAATQALVEAAVLTGDAGMRAAAQRGLDRLIETQVPGSGWRDAGAHGECDTLTAGWAFLALYMGRLGGFEVPDACFLGVRDLIDRATNRETGQTGFRTAADVGTKEVTHGWNEEYRDHPIGTVVAHVVRTLVDDRFGARREGLPWPQMAEKVIVCDLPTGVPQAKSIDHEYWLFGALALPLTVDQYVRYAYYWERHLLESTLAVQQSGPDACGRGCWPGDTRQGYGRWAFRGGSVYATAMAVLALESRTRYSGLPTLSALAGR